MSEFKKSRWAESNFSQSYRDKASVFLPYREQFIETVKSLYAHFIDSNTEARVLDLGCGDGFFVQELLKSFCPADITLVDGSAEMLKAAEKHFGINGKICYVNSSFQDLIEKESLNGRFDFIYSSLAIHHLPFEEKKHLYTYIYKLLAQDGFFVNYDVVNNPYKKTEKWYMSLWKQRIKDHPNKELGEKLIDIPKHYKENPDNIPNTLQLQLQILEEIGFKEVDSYFKYGIFSLFGGYK